MRDLVIIFTDAPFSRKLLAKRRSREAAAEPKGNFDQPNINMRLCFVSLIVKKSHPYSALTHEYFSQGYIGANVLFLATMAD